MNKKLFMTAMFLTLLMGQKLSFSMNAKQLFFRGSKGVGVLALPCLTAYAALKKYEMFKRMQANPYDELGMLVIDPAPKRVEQFARNRMEELGVSGAQSMSVASARTESWAAATDVALLVNVNDARKLDEALCIVADAKESDDEVLAHSHKLIARDRMLIAHESSHFINNDVKRFAVAAPVTASAVQVISSGISYTFNKMCNIENPKTWPKTIVRSSAALGTIFPKALIMSSGIIAYQRHREAMADEFACKNAKSLQDLEEFRDFFAKDVQEDINSRIKPLLLAIEQTERNKEMWQPVAEFLVDPLHPRNCSRVKMIQNHIDDWNAKHKEA